MLGIWYDISSAYIFVESSILLHEHLPSSQNLDREKDEQQLIGEELDNKSSYADQSFRRWFEFELRDGVAYTGLEDLHRMTSL